MRLLACMTTCLSAAAQGTFVVDSSSGPGTNFTEIQAAVLAVPSGSVLIGARRDLLLRRWIARWARYCKVTAPPSVATRPLLPQPCSHTP